MSKKSKTTDKLNSKQAVANTLATLLMLVLDIEESADYSVGRIFAIWCEEIASHWSKEECNAAAIWAHRRRLIASDHELEERASKPASVDRLPFQKRHGEVIFRTANTVWDRQSLDRYLAAELMKIRFEHSGFQDALWQMIDNGCTSEADILGLFMLALSPDVSSSKLMVYSNQRIDLHVTMSTSEVPNSLTQVQKLIADECGELCTVLIKKNKKYGNSALEPLRVFSKAPVDEQLKVRADDKLARILRGDADLEDEDVIKDLAGYLVLMLVERRMRKAGG